MQKNNHILYELVLLHSIVATFYVKLREELSLATAFHM